MKDRSEHLRPQVDAWLRDVSQGRQGCLMMAVESELANLPAHLKGSVGLVFEFPAAVRGLTTDVTGMWVTLRFGGTWHRCRIPWQAVTRMYDRDTLGPYKSRAARTEPPVRTPANDDRPLGPNVVPFRRRT